MYGAQQPLVKSRKYSDKAASSLTHFLTCVFCLLMQLYSVNSLSADGVTLLKIKAAIKSDPLELLSGWKDDGTDLCTWKGIGCDDSARVVSLNITGNAICGRAGASFNRTNGFCASFGSCPSAFLRDSESLCSSFGGVSCRMSGNSCEPVCLQNGTALDSSFVSVGSDKAPCRLTGFLSSAIGNLSQLRILSIPFNSFSGVIPKEIAALRFLEVLDLGGNAFSGSIPAEFGQLSHLKTLNLAYNSLKGEIPSELSGCRSIQIFNLAGNMLTGKIPFFLGNLPEVEVLALSFNQFVGTIPLELTRSCSNLQHLHLEGNFLTGKIPQGFGNCSQLRSLVVSSNILSGPIPADLGQLSMLQSLDVSRNSLGEEIPSELGNCSQLSLLVLTNFLDTESCRQHTLGDSWDAYASYEKDEFNYFGGTLPTSIVNLPRIRILWAPRTGLSGALPSYWGNCQSLEVLNLGGNTVTGKIPAGLAKCRSLIYLDLSANKLEGNIPQQLPIPCMVVFNISGNSLSGGVPYGSGDNCPSAELLNPPNSLVVSLDERSLALDFVYPYFLTLYCGNVASSMPVWFATQGMPVLHDMSQNNLTGPLPGLLLGASLIKKNPAYGFFLSGNQLMGAIPSSLFDSCQNFQTLSIGLSKNLFSEALPTEAMVGCKTLRHFEAASNQLTGSVLPGLGNLNHLVYLDLGMNKLIGEVPPQFGDLQELEYLVLADNSLTGKIPLDLGRLTSLVLLDLSGNKFTGEIPGDLANLKQLKELLLNNNYLSGNIPMNFTNLRSLVVMDVAFNNLSGSVPRIRNMESMCTSERFKGNEFLQSCSVSAPAPSLQQQDAPLPYADQIVVRESHRPNSIVIAAITSGCAIAAVLIILVLLFQFTKQRMPIQSGYRSGRKQVVTFGSIGFQLTYDNVVAATGNFSLSNLIGSGGFGATYKAELRPGLLVAVKRLSLGRFQGTQQFDAEIRTLGRIRHPNLVTLIGYHASESQMFLIYNYLPGGNLESLIHDSRRGMITWRVRYKIALDIAQALAYLHDECTPRVLHRDIKPSNVLLDNNLNAFLSDFGLARLLGASETHATTDVAGTFGYVAPEYAMTCRVSDKADVYSYGVVLLELLSGKKALDPSFSEYGHGFNIVAWACQLFQKGKAKDVFAPGLWEQGPHSELFDALKLAVKCTVDSLQVRPTMKQVVDVLKSLRS